MSFASLIPPLSDAERVRKASRRFRNAATPDTPTPEFTPDFSLERRVTAAREEMGEARWQQLMKEWDQ